MRKKKFLSILLALAMLLSLLPTVALAGEPHTHADLPNVEFKGVDELPTKAGSYYLINDIELYYTWYVESDINLCLNGYMIRYTGSNSAICVDPRATLNLYDCNTTTEHYFTEEDGLWVLQDEKDADTEHTVTGGIITGGNAGEGGGIYNCGTLNMYGGTIAGCTAKNYGGGVHNQGTFTMTGGSITGNTVNGSFGGGIDNFGFLYLGGTAKVEGNTCDGAVNNVYHKSDFKITLGTGTGDGGNGVPAPAEGMHVGVTMADGSGAFTDDTATAGALNYFFPDSGSQYIEYNDTDKTLNLTYGTAPKFAGAYLTIENDISVNFVVKADDCNGTAPSVAYSVDGKEDTVTGLLDATGENYVCRLTALNPSQIGADITATLLWNGKGTNFKTYSIATYCYNKLGDKTQKSDTFKTLLVDLLNYGAKAQKYVKPTTAEKDLCNYDLSDAQKARATQKPDLSKEAVQDIADPSVTASVHWGDKTLVLGSTVAIRCYIEESENVAGLTGKVLNGPNNVLQTAPLAYDKVKKQYYIEYAGLPAANMRDYPAFAVYNGDKLVSAYRLYSPAAYAAEALAGSDDTVKPLVTAMMIYGDAANAYWNEKNP